MRSPITMDVRLVRELKKHERDQCASLTLRRNGEMADTLRDLWFRRDPSAWVYRLSDTDNRLIGWGLLYEETYRVSSRYQRRWAACIYVRKTERRRGYGSWLLRDIMLRQPDAHVFPHDTASHALYRNVPKRQYA